MVRIWLPIGLIAVFGIGIFLGVFYYHLDPWWQSTVKPSVDSSSQQPKAVSCFVSDFDCEKLERVELNGRFVGYGLKLTTQVTLLSPITGATTTGQVNFALSAGGYRYPTLSIHPNGLDDPTRLEYVFPRTLDFTVSPVTPGDRLLTLEPGSESMPPYGEYDLLIQAFDDQAQVVDPLIYLP